MINAKLCTLAIIGEISPDESEVPGASPRGVVGNSGFGIDFEDQPFDVLTGYNDPVRLDRKLSWPTSNCAKECIGLPTTPTNEASSPRPQMQTASTSSSWSRSMAVTLRHVLLSLQVENFSNASDREAIGFTVCLPQVVSVPARRSSYIAGRTTGSAIGQRFCVKLVNFTSTPPPDCP